jgi:hypothetical protein
MKLIPKIFPSRKKVKRFIVVDIGLGRVNMGVFDNTPEGPKFVGVGRRSFTTADTLLDATLEATDALGAIIDELPQTAIIGVCGGTLETVNTVAKYTREKPSKPIDKEEISQILKKLSAEEKTGLKVFFSTVNGATIDGAKVTNPIGVKGEKVELNCFVAYKSPEELTIYEQIIEELEIKPEKIFPTSQVVSKMIVEKIPEQGLLLRIGQNRSEAAFIENKHLVKVANFDLGFEQLDFLNSAVQVLLEEQKEKLNFIWLYSDSDEVNLIDVKEKIAEVDWKKKLNLKEELQIERAESENNFGPADMGLLALSLQEIIG